MIQVTDEMKVAAVKAYTEVDGKCRPAAMQKALEAALPFLPIAGKPDMLRLAVAAVLEADKEFRANMPPEWEGDPLSDEIDGLRRVFSALSTLPIAGEGKDTAIADELTDALDGAFVTTTSGGGQRPHLTVTFPENSQIRRLFDALAAFSSLRRTPSSPGKDGGQEVEAVGELREALQRLEDCCDQLAGTRSREVYDAMINSGQAEALIDLDNARLNAREVLSRPSPYPVSDTVAVVTGDAALALGLPEGTKLYTRPQPASTALVEAAKGLKRIVEEIDGAMNHGTWRDDQGNRLKDTPEWVALYNALGEASK